ncbi:MAG: Rrf2 family transcriptional regulator [Candidatus Omnitrophica bacterium]|nr:Rrf2 family transcriptional regulator [Candidatus Omnitrophota bacterium]MBU1808086.1 Rrf2 family transcriptional regulator [Candidatus Omnitrophota bacterium]
MKITYKGDYALKALLQLALCYDGPDGGVLSIAEIAKLGDMPTKFLEQILLALRRGSFVKSRRGVKGGFLLAKDPKEITIGDVIRFVEGPIESIACVEKGAYTRCKDIKSCIFRDVWREVSDAVSIVVDTVTFEELVHRYKERSLRARSVYEYSI